MDVIDIAEENDEDEDKALIEQIKRDSLKQLEESEKMIQKTDNHNVSTTDIFYQGDDAKGFFMSAGETYIYPTNYPIRDYQRNIVHSCLFENTLVSLPTGLGKTFIAAVVMFNFYRWYPRGKIVFMAPTRPLVSQQMRACYDIMGIPVEDTVELLGTTNVIVRKKEWHEKRVFYVTPQTIDNDLRSGVFNPEHLKCLVIDEAHRATKNYAYCQVVQQLREANVKFRVVALSATPGREIQDVINLIRKLDIAKLELRSENSIDIVPYTHSKKIDSVEVPLSDLVLRVREEFLKIVDKYTRSLKQNKVLVGNTGTLTKFLVMLAKERYVKTKAQFPHINRDLDKMIQRDFHVTHSLASALENLITYGLRSFYNNLVEVSKEDGTCPLLGKDNDLQELLQQLKPKLDTNILSNDYAWSHLKFIRLREILETHFRTHAERGETTKVIIFANFRIVVAEIAEVLKPLEPMVKASMFVGQSSGVTQQEQKDIMRKFRAGEFNTLIATSVGEEGLDIGEIDLVICFDSQKSPIKLVQRLGRTGRKRNGRCVFLLTQGKEAHNFQTSMHTCKSYVEKIINNKTIYSSLAQNGPRMIPSHVTPEMRCLHIVVKERVTPAKPSKKKAVEPVEKPKGKRSRKKLDNSEAPAKASRPNAKRPKIQPMSQSNDIRTCFENIKKKKKTFVDFITQSSGEVVTAVDNDEVVIVKDQLSDFETLFAKLENWAEKCSTNDELILDDEFFGLMDTFLIDDADQTPVDVMDVDQMLETKDRMLDDVNKDARMCEASNAMSTPVKVSTQQRSNFHDFSDTFHLDLMHVFSSYETNRVSQHEETLKPVQCSSPNFANNHNGDQNEIKENQRDYREAFEEEILDDGNDDMFLNINSLVPNYGDNPLRNKDANVFFKDREVIEKIDEPMFSNESADKNQTIKQLDPNVPLPDFKEPYLKVADKLKPKVTPIESNIPETKQLDYSVYQSVDELFASDEEGTSPVVENNDIRSYFVSEAELRDGGSYVEPMSVSDLFEDSPDDEDLVEMDERNGDKNGKHQNQKINDPMFEQRQVNQESMRITNNKNQAENQLFKNDGISISVKTPARNSHRMKIQDWPCSSTPMTSGQTQKKLTSMNTDKAENNPSASPDFSDIFFTQSKATATQSKNSNSKNGRSPFTPKQKLSHFFQSPDVSEIKSQAVKPSNMSGVKINLESKFNGTSSKPSMNKVFPQSKSQNRSKSPSCEIIFDSDSDEHEVITNKPSINLTSLDGSNMFTVTQLVDMACEREKKLKQTKITSHIQNHNGDGMNQIYSSNKENRIAKPSPRKLDGMDIVDCSDDELMLDVQASQGNDKSLIDSYVSTRHLAHPKPNLPQTKSVLTKLSFVEENLGDQDMNKQPLVKTVDMNAIKKLVDDSSDEDFEFFIPKRNVKKDSSTLQKSPLLLSKTKSKIKVNSQTPKKNTAQAKNSTNKMSNLSLNDSDEEIELLKSLAKANQDFGYPSNTKYFADVRKPSTSSYTKPFPRTPSSENSKLSLEPSQKQKLFNKPAIPTTYTSKVPNIETPGTKLNKSMSAQHTQSTAEAPAANLEEEFGGMTDAQFEEWLKNMNEPPKAPEEPVRSQYFAPKPTEPSAHHILMANRANLDRLPSQKGPSQRFACPKPPTKTTLTNKEKEDFSRFQRTTHNKSNNSSSNSILTISSDEDEDLYFFRTTGKPETRPTEAQSRKNIEQSSKCREPTSSKQANKQNERTSKPNSSKSKSSSHTNGNAGRKKSKKKKPANPYIEVEADVSLMEGERMSSDDDLTNTSEDEMDSSFIDDEQDRDHTMAVYLKSVR